MFDSQHSVFKVILTYFHTEALSIYKWSQFLSCQSNKHLNKETKGKGKSTVWMAFA
jgi:hypothetical protein